MSALVIFEYVGQDMSALYAVMIYLCCMVVL